VNREDYYRITRERIKAIRLILDELEQVAAADPVDTGTIHTLADFITKNAVDLRDATGQYVIESTANRFSVKVLPMLSDGGKVSTWAAKSLANHAIYGQERSSAIELPSG
jgi:aconitase B